MKVVAVVPIKLNSLRLPNKNIKPFRNGNPLCWYIMNTLLQIKVIDEIYVYCSSEKILDYIPEGIKYIKRSTELDSDSTKINEVLSCFSKNIDADVYLMAHTTAPFIKAESIERGLYAVIDEGFDSSFSVKKMQDFMWKDGTPINYSLEDIPRTQDLDPIYCESSGFYIYKRNIIKNYGRRIGFNPYLVEVSEVESIDIDEKEDFEIADAIYNYCCGE